MPSRSENNGPLAGVRVVDLSRLAPGPYGSMMLGDMGADVIRVDHPRGEVRRGDMVSRNKRAIALDLKKDGGRRVLYRLVEDADVFLEGNRPGVTKRLGCDYQTISGVNPRIVYCSLTGFGQQGPMAQHAGHDINYIALAGVLGQIGDGINPPVPPLNLVADFGGGGLLAAFGIVCALLERQSSGQGQYIDAAMIDGAASLMATHFANSGLRSEPGVGVLGGGSPFYRCYRASCGGYVSVGAMEPQFFAALCEGTGLSELKDKQHDTASWPLQIEAFAARFAEKTRDAWTLVFDPDQGGFDACVAPVLELDEAPEHPHAKARDAFLTGPDGALHVAPAPRLSRTPGSIRAAEPARMGQDSRAILEEAGFATDEIAALEKEGAIVT